MQILVSMNNSEQWEQVLTSCQLEQRDNFELIKEQREDLSGIGAFCLNFELNLDQLTELLSYPDIQLVLSLNAPELIIGALLQQGKLLSDALDTWQQQSLSILQLHQKHRRKLQLAQVEGLLMNPSDAPDWLSIEQSSANQKASLLFTHNIYHLIAVQALRQNPEAEYCWQRLIGSSLPLLEQPQFHFNLEQLQQEFVVDKTVKFESKCHENNLLQEQLFKLQEELEALLNKNNKLVAQQHQLNSEKQEFESAQKQLLESKNENNLMLQQLFNVQERLEHLLLEKQGKLALLKEALENSQKKQLQLEQELKESKVEQVLSTHKQMSAQAELSMVKNSKIWKSIAPVHKLVKRLKDNRLSKQFKRDATLIAQSEYFDEIWYLQTYPDIVKSGANPAEHYLAFGFKEGRSPGPLFDGNWYLSEYPDVAEGKVNPLLHYVKFGAVEGRNISPKLLPSQKKADLVGGLPHKQNIKVVE